MKLLSKCPILSDPMDCSPPGSSIHGIFQARVLEWSAIAFSNPSGSAVQMAPREFLIYTCRCSHGKYSVVDGTPLQYSCLENPMDGGAWWAAVHGVSKSWTRLSDFTFTFHFHALEEEMATHSSVLAWRIPGTGEPGGCRLWGRTESDTTEATA